MTHNFTIDAKAFEPCIKIHGKDNEPILEISYRGEVIWHAEDQASEAAKVFCDNLNIGVEHKAGIKESRKEWENSIKKSILELYESGELTRNTLEELFYKDEFKAKLKGTDET